jgi:hypothetical protein
MDLINRLERKPISDIDILKTIRTRIIKYSQLKIFRHIDDIFINGSFVILIENPSSNVGHWVCVVKRGVGKNAIISYFDSYGRKPDPPLYLGCGIPYLTRLLLNSGYVVEYNKHNYQGRGTSTCGRHCIVRIIMKDKPLSDYRQFMNMFKNDDKLVTAITSMIRK